MIDKQKILNSFTKESILYTALEKDQVKCLACAHRCRIPEGRSGICKIRFNQNGKLFSPFGYVSALNPDPIEKKPFFHVFPGSTTLSFGMLGCNLKCDFCQNWSISQLLKDPAADSQISEITPSQIVNTARKVNSKIITSTYNEPVITSEWAIDIYKLASQYGIEGAYVSNGYCSMEVIDFIKPYVKYFKVDLKTFNESNYKKLGANLNKVLETIKILYQEKFWIEIVTLLIPDYNNSNEELDKMAKFISSVSLDIPWHITAFHKDYKRKSNHNTTSSDLLKAIKIGKENGIKFIYAGNIPTREVNYENTYCPKCNKLLVERFGFKIIKNLMKSNYCPECNTYIAGKWL